MSTPASSPEWQGHVVLVGHRGAGKSRLLETVARRLGRPGVDLDGLIAEREGVPARALFERSEEAFRLAERRAFASIGGRAVIAAGGGFLSHHADLLVGHTPVLVPIDFETYRARLLEDVTRPRLRPGVSLEEEIAAVFAEREALHARVATVPLDRVLP